MTTVWFVAALGLADDHVAQRRGFRTAAEHDADLIARWNQRVKRADADKGTADDQVWILGNVSSRRAEQYVPILGELNGQLHLVAGNQDPAWPGHRHAYKTAREWFAVYASIQTFAWRLMNGRRWMVSHFPYEGGHTPTDRYVPFRLRDCGFPLVCGHAPWKTSWTSAGTLQVNVGLDVWKRPVHIMEIVALIEECYRDEAKCPRCGKRGSLAPAGAGLFLCNSCGHIDAPE